MMQLLRMSIDPNFIELTADVFRRFFSKYDAGSDSRSLLLYVLLIQRRWQGNEHLVSWEQVLPNWSIVNLLAS